MAMPIRIPAEELLRFAGEIFESAGLDPAEARDAAEVLVWADARGIRSHGMTNLAEIYVPKLRSGEIRAGAPWEEVSRFGTTALYSAHGGLGLLSGRRAMAEAIAIAAEHGVGCVAVRESTHFGPAGFYAEMALGSQQIGVAMTNLGGRAVAAPIGGSACLGTNPIAVAAGDPDRPFYSFDASTTVVATGKIKEAARRGEPVPEGWLYRRDGEPTRDPAEYLSGAALPPALGGAVETGGFKGFGYNLLVELLCGLLTGGPIALDADSPDRPENEGIGHFFLALNVEGFRAPEPFCDAVTAAMTGYRDRGRREDWRGLTYPGAPEAEKLDRSSREGVLVDDILLGRMADLARLLNVNPIMEKDAE
jgi:LDH2 family malate/lactate/ureidoglycolate dehydrogenase